MSTEAAQPGAGLAPEPLPDPASSGGDLLPGLAPEPLPSEQKDDSTAPRPAVPSHRADVDVLGVGPLDPEPLDAEVDAGPLDSEVADPEPAGSATTVLGTDVVPADSGPVDAGLAGSEPVDAQPVDAQPADGEPLDGEPAGEATVAVLGAEAVLAAPEPVHAGLADAEPADTRLGEDAGVEDGAEEAAPSWWRRDHPISSALFGFYAGMLFAVIVPGAYAAIMGAFYDESTVTRNYLYVLVALVVPLGLVIARATRRFGLFMWLGIVSTLVVVLGVAGGVGWYLVKHG